MTITATISDGVFTIAGESEAEPGRFVEVEGSGFVYDNAPEFGIGPKRVGDEGATFIVPVDDDGSDILKIDASGITGAGIVIQAGGEGLEIVATRQDDVILVFGDAVQVDAGEGADLILAGEGETGLSMAGGAGADTIYAGDGDDVLIGGAGDDAITGEDGADVAVYSGVRTDYEITVENGVYIVRDLREGAPDGSDRIADVEQLRFSDGTVDLAPLTPGLTATAEGGVLTVSGEGLSGGGSLPFASDKVYVSSLSRPLFVRDGGELHPVIPVADDGSDIRVIDVTGVEGVGVDVTAYARGVRVFGSEQADEIFAINQGDVRGVVLGHGGDDIIRGDGIVYLSGGAGDDTLLGYENDDTLVGGVGNDSLHGNEGADILTGGRGDDALDGSYDADVAVYTGNMADYVLTTENGFYVLTDLRTGRDGVDVLKNIEQLRFADGVMDLDPAPNDVDATLADGVLTVTGDASFSDEFLFIDSLSASVRALPDVDIAVDGDGSAARTIDARGVTGVGVYIEAEVSSSRVFGSAQDDLIFIDARGPGRNVAQGGDGDDRIFGDSSRDVFVGGAGNDRLGGRGGDDTLTGGQGDDLIDGGSGADVAVYSGDRANYLVEQVYDYYRVTDLRPGYNGVDLIRNVEELQFKDGTFDVASFFPTPDEGLI